MSSNDTTMLVGATPSGRGNIDYIDTSAYRFEAVVDWFSFRIKTVDPTQWPHIQRHLAGLIGSKPHVIAIDPDTGKKKGAKGAEGITSTVFDFQVYDDIANNGEKLRDLFAHLASKFPLAGTPQVTGIEIAFDAYSLGKIDSELHDMALWMMERLNAANDNVRQYDPLRRVDGENVPLWGRPELPINPRWNLRMGNEWNDLCHQVYWKRTDKGAVDLLPAECRARSEFTLRRATLAEEGIKTLSDLETFDFGRLAKYLRFRGLKTADQIIAENEDRPSWLAKVAYDPRAVCLTGGRGRGLKYSTGKIRKSTPRKNSKHTLRTKETDAMNDTVTRNFKALNSNFHTFFRTENNQTTTPTPLEPA
jgi:hypothetical protein